MSTPSKIKLLVQEPESGSQHADARQLPKRQAVNLQIRSESPFCGQTVPLGRMQGMKRKAGSLNCVEVLLGSFL